MQHQHKINLVNQLEAYMLQHKISQTAIAENAGVNAAYLISMRKRDFTVKAGGSTVKIADKYFKRVADLIGFEAEGELWAVKKTMQLKELTAALMDAKANSETAVITGETGCGKSFGCDIFRRKFPNEVFIVKVGSSDNLSDLLDKVLEALGVDILKRSKSDRLRTIAAHMKKLSEKSLEPVLIFDECEFMKQPALCSIKELYDMLINWCAIVLVGTEQLTDNIEKLRLRNKPGIPQFYRRIKFRVRNLPAINRDFPDFLIGFETGLKRFLKTNCDNYGELHDVLVPAKREAERTGNELTEDFVKMVLGI